MPDPAPITAEQFARELLKKLDAERAAAKEAIVAARNDGLDENANGIKHQSFGVKVAIKHLFDLAAKHGIKLEGGE